MGECFCGEQEQDEPQIGMVCPNHQRHIDTGEYASERKRASDGGRIVPVSITDANKWVAKVHRHHKPVTGAKFAVGWAEGDAIRAVAIVGRPVSRHLDDGWTLEVNRVASDGASNACSALYAACWRAARALGYRKLVTYTLASEPGTSLRAAGWKVVGQTKGADWSRDGRPRVPGAAQLFDKVRWEPVPAATPKGGAKE